jgi:GNAT superfamily N-acetyltransferase
VEQIKIIPLQEKHLEDATVLVSARYRAFRKQVPLLPTRYEDVNVLLPMLRELAQQAPGVAAIQGDRLVGFLLGFVIPSFLGQRSVYSPEWANSAELEDSRRIYEEMYAHLSAQWVADGCITHLIGQLADDHDGREGWQWLGFGLIAADAIRDLSPIPDFTAGVEIRQAGAEDLERVSVLTEGLRQHLAAAPTFFPHPAGEGSHDADWLGNSANTLRLAYQGMEAVACMGQGPANPDACTIIADEGTTSIVSAFTQEGVRGRGIATALLNQCLDWARATGYERCAVDFEPTNFLATRFWMRYFQPVSYALARHLPGM